VTQLAVARQIVLMGLMGAGKSTIGRVLAERLQRPLSDSDVKIAARTGLSARQLKADLGVDELHRLEAEHLLGALADDAPSVVCAAASTIDEPRCRQALQGADVFSVWLHAPPELLGARFASGAHRPAYGDDPAQFMAAQLRARGRWFAEIADLQLASMGRPSSEVVDEIVSFGSMIG
jgi:shikimate kinase